MRNLLRNVIQKIFNLWEVFHKIFLEIFLKNINFKENFLKNFLMDFRNNIILLFHNNYCIQKMYLLFLKLQRGCLSSSACKTPEDSSSPFYALSDFDLRNLLGADCFMFYPHFKKFVTFMVI